MPIDIITIYVLYGDNECKTNIVPPYQSEVWSPPEECLSHRNRPHYKQKALGETRVSLTSTYITYWYCTAYAVWLRMLSSSAIMQKWCRNNKCIEYILACRAFRDSLILIMKIWDLRTLSHHNPWNVCLHALTQIGPGNWKAKQCKAVAPKLEWLQNKCRETSVAACL